MDYKQALKEQMEAYYQITASYRGITMDAAKAARKPGLFKKQDYTPYITGFRTCIADVRKLNLEKIEIPKDDKDAQNLAEFFNRSVLSFILLCEENVKFYEMTDRKQYRDSGVTVKSYAEAANMLQNMLAGAVRELEKLETAYKEYFADDFAQQ